MGWISHDDVWKAESFCSNAADKVPWFERQLPLQFFNAVTACFLNPCIAGKQWQHISCCFNIGVLKCPSLSLFLQYYHLYLPRCLWYERFVLSEMILSSKGLVNAYIYEGKILVATVELSINQWMGAGLWVAYSICHVLSNGLTTLVFYTTVSRLQLLYSSIDKEVMIKIGCAMNDLISVFYVFIIYPNKIKMHFRCLLNTHNQAKLHLKKSSTINYMFQILIILFCF